MSEPQVIITRMGEPIHLTIGRTAKGKVQHEISIHAASVEDIKRLTDQLEEYVRAKYAGQLAGEEAP